MSKCECEQFCVREKLCPQIALSTWWWIQSSRVFFSFRCYKGSLALKLWVQLWTWGKINLCCAPQLWSEGWNTTRIKVSKLLVSAELQLWTFQIKCLTFRNRKSLILIPKGQKWNSRWQTAGQDGSLAMVAPLCGRRRGSHFKSIFNGTAVPVRSANVHAASVMRKFCVSQIQWCCAWLTFKTTLICSSL